MKINWFSPLPPAMTEIASYTVRILPALQERAEVILWTDQTGWDPNLEKTATVRYYKPDRVPWDDLNRGDLTIFNIGNNHLFHGAIWQVSRRHPGIVILHDLSLQHFFLGVYMKQLKDRNGYLEKMAFYYGQQGRDYAAMAWDGRLTPDEVAEKFPLTPLALEQATGVIVHTPNAFQNLKCENRWPVCYAPLPYAASHMPVGDAPKPVKLKAPGPPYNLIVFGYIGSNRRLNALLQALANFKERDKFRLSIYGELENKCHIRIRSLISSLGLKNLIRIHGFVPEAELDSALSSAHMAVNLRYPTMGEASGSQLRIWYHALPSLVSKVGWYADIPEEAVVFVRPENEIEDIQEHLRAFLENPGRFAKMGEAGRRILKEHHDPGAYAQAIIGFSKEVCGFHPPAIANYLTARCAAEMAVWSRTAILDIAISKAAKEIMKLCNICNSSGQSGDRGCSGKKG